MATNGATAHVPPQNLDAERSVLGAMMVSAASLDPVFADVRLASEDFYRERHRVVYDAVKALYERDEAVDALTVTEYLTQNGRIDDAGGRAEVQSLPDQVPAPGNARHYAAIVKQNALLRRLLAAAQEIQRSVHEHEGEPQHLAEQAERLLFEAAHREQAGDFNEFSEILHAEVDRLEALATGDASVTGVPSGFIDLDAITGGFQPGNLIIVAARPGMGKCLPGSALVYDPGTGARRRLRDIVDEVERGEEAWVAALGIDQKLVPARVAAAFRNGRKTIHRLTTRLGRRIEATDNHPLLTIEGWTPLSQLKPGDRIAVPRSLPRNSPSSEMEDHELVMLAALIADGSLTKGTPRFCFGDASGEVVEEVRRAAAAFGLRLNEDGSGTATISAGRGANANPVRELCEHHGIWGKRSGDKFVPDAVLGLADDQIARFLSVLYACDGHIYVGRSYSQVGYTTISERLARDVQHLLLRLGIIATIRHLRRPVYDGTGKRALEVRITGRNGLVAFCHRIGALGKHEKASAVLGSLAGTRETTNVDTLPSETWTRIRSALGDRPVRALSEATGRPPSHNWHIGKRGISRELLSQIAVGLDDQELWEFATSDLWWDEVVSVEEFGEDETFDLNIPGLHNFVADDVLVHNSGMVINIADHLAREKGKAVAMFSLEMSEMEIAQRMIASRARIPSDKLRKGKFGKQDWQRVVRAGNELERARLWIDDSSDLGMLDLRAKARRLHASESAGDGQGLALIIVDYLQLMRPDDPRANRVEQVGQMSRGLKILARELEIPVLALSQLSRAPEQRTGRDKRPILSDLRESGNLEQDSDLVAFIYRDDYYNDEPEEPGVAELIVRKNRHGPTDTVKLAFKEPFASFANLAREDRQGARRSEEQEPPLIDVAEDG
jgi:replicative DNA helicase